MSTRFQNSKLAIAVILGIGALSVGGYSVAFAQNAPSAPPAAGAPGPGGRAARRGGGGPMHSVEVGLKAAGIDAGQKAQVKEIATKYRTDLKAIDRHAPDRRSRVKELNDQTLTSIKAVLRPDQLSKFQEAYDRANAWGSPFGRGLNTLNLTEDEKSKVTPILVSAVSDWQKTMEDTSIRGAARREKMTSLASDLKSKVRPLLTADQQTQLDSLEFMPRRGAGRRAGGAAGAGLPS